MQELKNELTHFYGSQNLLEVNLRTNCHRKEKCWTLSSQRHSNYHIYHPYIGSKYHQERIMVIGINMNDYGGSDAATYLANKAQKEIQAGKIMTFANKSGYRGSLLWHRLLSYAAILLQTKGAIPINSDKKHPTKEDLSNAFPYIAFTNSIKCSPKKNNSTPSKGMRENCPDYILKKEIGILRPKTIIILGVQNKNNLKSLLSFKKINHNVKSIISLFDFQNNGEVVKAICIPHPASSNRSSSGRAKARMDELRSIASSLYNK